MTRPFLDSARRRGALPDLADGHPRHVGRRRTRGAGPRGRAEGPPPSARAAADLNPPPGVGGNPLTRRNTDRARGFSRCVRIQRLQAAGGRRAVRLRCDHRRPAYAKPAGVKLDAERKAGAILTATQLDPGGPVRSRRATALNLADLGVSKSQSSRWQQLAAIPDQAWAGHGSRS